MFFGKDGSLISMYYHKSLEPNVTHVDKSLCVGFLLKHGIQSRQVIFEFGGVSQSPRPARHLGNVTARLRAGKSARAAINLGVIDKYHQVAINIKLHAHSDTYAYRNMRTKT